MRSSRRRVRRSSAISCVLARPRAARSASASKNGSCSSGDGRDGASPSPRLPSSRSATSSGRLIQCRSSMAASRSASASSCASARSASSSSSGDHPRAALAQLRDREVDLLAGRLPRGEEGGRLGPGRALVVRGEPARRAGLVDEVERAGVGDPRHQQRHQRVDALVGPARPVGEPLDLEQQLEALVALADPGRRAGHAGRREREPHLGPVPAGPLADVAAGGHRGHHRQPEAEPRALGVRGHPAPVVDHAHEDRALAGLGGQRHAAALAADERVDDRVRHGLRDGQHEVLDGVFAGAVGAREVCDASAQLADHGGLRVDLAVPPWGCDVLCH